MPVSLQEWRGDPADYHPNRPPFEAGNKMALVHGAYSVEVYGPEAAAEFERLVAMIEAEPVPHLMRPSFLFALEGLAEALGRVRVIRKHMATEHDEDGTCDRETCARTLAEIERLVDRRLDATGLSPSSRARIERDLSLGQRARIDTGLELERARAVRRAAQARMANEASPQPPDDVNTDDGDVQDPREKAD